MLISSTALKTNAGGYGGLERVCAEEAQGLAELGHEVTLVASKGSKAPPKVELIETVPSWDSLNPAQQQAYAKSDRLWNGWRAHEEAAYRMYEADISKFDIVLDMSWSKWSYTSKKDEIIGLCHSMYQYNTPPPREIPMRSEERRVGKRV